MKRGPFDGISKVGKATRAQIEFIADLCDRLNDDDPLVSADQLTTKEASELIDELKERWEDLKGNL